MFWLKQSPFILEGTLDAHFDNCGDEFWEAVEKVRDMYVDDFVTEGESINEVQKLKSDSINIFRQGGFKIHKWHSNEKKIRNQRSV